MVTLYIDLNHFRSAAVTEQELTGAKKALVMSSEQRASNPTSLASHIGSAALSGGSVAISQTAAINSVTMGDVQVSGSEPATISGPPRSKIMIKSLNNEDCRVRQKFDSEVA